MSNSSKLRTVVIYGSARRDRQGIKAARFIVRQLEKRGHDVTLVDSQEYNLPLLDLMYKEYAPGKAPRAMQKVAEILGAADGFIIVSAEYNHSIPAGGLWGHALELAIQLRRADRERLGDSFRLALLRSRHAFCRNQGCRPPASQFARPAR